ncbi:DMT family transporter [Psychromarinibacter sp. C21-152]|uniref:DMT family transporter n=1 Tax=Psychromarinibacter sediminicola TaxID=3033385 RepID=A0AAE3NR44_9RHOB|nr:DMT family transporter [Psychromarinibacter sediminicola]MDF0600906.1 DMT family transporter [Psychromarinibacter sediminicola]
MSAPDAPAVERPMQLMRGIGLMVLAMALLALSDMFIKAATRGGQPPGQVLLLMTVGGTVFFVLIARIQGAQLLSRAMLHPAVLWRNLFEVVGSIGLVLGLTYVPLSQFAAIMQMAPLIVVIGAATILKEPVGARRWMAVAAGIVGMLLVVRPGMEGFTPTAFFALMGVSGLALRDLVTRLSPPGIPSISLSTWGFAVTIPFGAVLMALMGDAPRWSGPAMWHVAGAVVVTALGYYSLTVAMRVAPVSVVAPFRYARLVFTMGLGILVFGERPDALTLLGAAIILVAGLYTFLRERQLARRLRRVSATEASR